MIVVANAGPLIALAYIGHLDLLRVLYGDTVGTLIMAKKQGYIPAVTPLLDKLLVSGFRMSDELYRIARALAGEGLGEGGEAGSVGAGAPATRNSHTRNSPPATRTLATRHFDYELESDDFENVQKA